MTEERINVAVEIGNVKVILEGPRDFVEAEVRRLTASVVNPPSSDIEKAMASAETARRPQGERDFLSQKEPKGHAEIVATLAFYLTEQGVEEFTEQDIRRAYIRAGIKPPKVVAQAMRDAKNKRDFLKQGSSRGTYKLTPYGDSFVRFDLAPGRDDV